MNDWADVLPRVREAMRRVDRAAFMPEEVRDRAEEDGAVPIGLGQTISQPYVVGVMCSQFVAAGCRRVMEIGGGGGYHAAVLARLMEQVVSVEIIGELAERARRTLREQGISNVTVVHGDGRLGYAAAGPYDGISVACAMEEVPPAWWEQLTPRGIIVAPMGPTQGVQQLRWMSRGAGRGEERDLLAVRFVPMTTQVR